MPQLQTEARKPETPELLRGSFDALEQDINTFRQGGFPLRSLELLPLGGIIKGINTPAQKKIITGIARKAPELLKRIIKSPETLTVFKGVNPQAPTASGTFRRVNPLFGQMTINPSVFKGRPPVRGADPIFGNLPATAVHEATHFVNRGRLAKMDKIDASTAANLIGEFLPFETGQGQIKELLMGVRQPSSPISAFDEALAFLRGLVASGKASPEAKALANALFLSGAE